MKANLKDLLIYRNLLADPILQGVHKGKLTSSSFKYQLIELAEAKGLSGCVIEKHIFQLVASDENIFTVRAEQGLPIGETLYEAVLNDIYIIVGFVKALYSEVAGEDIHTNYRPSSPSKVNSAFDEISRIMAICGEDCKRSVQLLAEYYQKHSYGTMAKYDAFVWRVDKGLVGVENKSIQGFDCLVGYERQKQKLKENTLGFLAGLPANNVLLYGDRGTGKSSSIKALIPEFADKGLKLVEISKDSFAQLPEIMATLGKYGRKFILILDDLSFECFEVEYKQLKSYIDGALEQRPDNVLIYATSNRRNIINETWKDQQGEELHVRDSINERSSLVDRFGIKIYYESPDQEEFYAIVEELAKGRVDIEPEELRKEALKWQMSSSGRSGRVARNLVNHLIARNDKRALDDELF